jgi:UDP-GlcNAc:undecaprenyl-phosphate GlcNAc-1-phosphate transferase
MTTLLFVFGLSLTICVVLTPIVRMLAAQYALVDQPDGRRKMHAVPTPLAGGIAILLSGHATVIVAATASPLRGELQENGLWLVGLCIASLILSMVGLADDRWQLRGRHKLIWQLLTIGLLLGCGVLVRKISVFGLSLELGLLSIPFTTFLLLGAINSLNLMDGMDGLLSCIGLIICLAIAALAMLAGHWAAACVSIALAEVCPWGWSSAY